MTNKTPLMKLTARISLVCFLLVSFQQAAMAGIVTTTEIVDQQVVQLNKQRINDLLSQQEVQSQLIALGVDPQDAKQRLANMTDEQIQAFAGQMDEAPAGSGVVGTLAFIFIVLLITDLMGFTDVFPFVKKTVYD
jgi:hypothetical protein